MNTKQRSRLIQLIKQHFLYTDPCDVDHVLQWEIIAETLNALGPSQTIDQWIDDWETIKSSATNKLKEIKAKESEGLEIPEDLKLTEEDHRVIKICTVESDADKMAKLVKMLDCRAVSPFENEPSDSDVAESEDEEHTHKSDQGIEVNDCLNGINKIIAERNMALNQLEEQKKINVQLADLLANLKMPVTQSSGAN